MGLIAGASEVAASVLSIACPSIVVSPSIEVSMIKTMLRILHECKRSLMAKGENSFCLLSRKRQKCSSQNNAWYSFRALGNSLQGKIYFASCIKRGQRQRTP
jgi:hypothetical protein